MGKIKYTYKMITKESPYHSGGEHGEVLVSYRISRYPIATFYGANATLHARKLIQLLELSDQELKAARGTTI